MASGFYNIDQTRDSTISNSGTTGQQVTQTRTEQGTSTQEKTSATTDTGNGTTTETREQTTARNGQTVMQRALTGEQSTDEAQTVLADIGATVTFKILIRGKLGTVPPEVAPPPGFLAAQTS